MPSFLTNLFNAVFGSPASTRGRDKSRTGRGASTTTMRGLEILEERDDGTLMFDLNGAFYVSGRRSPNGRFLVGAVDGHQEGDRLKSGKVVLVDLNEGTTCFRKSLKRANNPWVSDDGLVTVENWLDWGGPLGGEVVAFHPSGERAWKRRYKANVYGTHLAEDGRQLLISTCNSDHAPHSGKTWLVDASTGTDVWCRDGFGAVRFEGSTPVIGTEGDRQSPTNEFFPLDGSGQAPAAFEAAQQAASDRHNRGQPWWVLGKVNDALKGEVSVEDLQGLLPLLDEMEREHQLDDKTQAKAHRARGEIAEHAGDLQTAYTWWSRALELDPKVGIKRRHTALGKKLGG